MRARASLSGVWNSLSSSHEAEKSTYCSLAPPRTTTNTYLSHTPTHTCEKRKKPLNPPPPSLPPPPSVFGEREGRREEEVELLPLFIHAVALVWLKGNPCSA